MTEPEPEPETRLTSLPPFDTGNPLLSLVPASLSVSPQNTPNGQRLAVTVRTVDTTLTVFLTGEEVDRWRSVLGTGRNQLSGLILPGM